MTTGAFLTLLTIMPLVLRHRLAVVNRLVVRLDIGVVAPVLDAAIVPREVEGRKRRRFTCAIFAVFALALTLPFDLSLAWAVGVLIGAAGVWACVVGVEVCAKGSAPTGL